MSTPIASSDAGSAAAPEGRTRRFFGLIWQFLRSLTWPGWVALSGTVLIAIGLMLSPFPPVRIPGAVAEITGFFLLLADALFGGGRFLYRARKAITKWAVVLVLFALAFLYLFAPSLAFMLSNGEGKTFHHTYAFITHPSGFFGDAEGVLLLSVPCFLVVVPEILRRKPRWKCAPNDLRKALPGWLAAIAAAATGGYGFLLHLRGGPLYHPAPGTLSVAILFAVALLVPFYKFVAQGVLERGVSKFFDPASWWRMQRTMLSEVVKGLFEKASQAADSHDADTEHPPRRVPDTGGSG
jgi:hypothetical protein